MPDGLFPGPQLRCAAPYQGMFTLGRRALVPGRRALVPGHRHKLWCCVRTDSGARVRGLDLVSAPETWGGSLKKRRVHIIAQR